MAFGETYTLQDMAGRPEQARQLHLARLRKMELTELAI